MQVKARCNTKASLESKVLLILENTPPIFLWRGLIFAGAIILLLLPPYCSHKLQSLDHSVYVLLKRLVNSCSATDCCVLT